MSERSNEVLYIAKIAVLTLGILIFPFICFQYQDQRLFSQAGEIDMNVFQMDKVEKSVLTLEEKLKLLNGSDTDIKYIQLKTGDRFSLYEARRSCFRELCKIPVLEASIYGPQLNDIDITPYLLIDSKTPSSSMLIWNGFLTLKDVKYQITLEEESGKLLLIQPVEKEDNVLNVQWEKYLMNP